MRSKNPERRRRIVAVATTVFCEHGYSHATMSMISARLGGSKATLWSYFPSKEQLFIASMEAVRARWSNLEDICRDEDEHLKLVLSRFAHIYLEISSTEESLMIRRTIIGHPEISKFVGNGFIAPTWHILAAYLQRQTAHGKIRNIDCHDYARMFIALLDSGYVDHLLYGVRPVSCAGHVRQAVEFFIRSFEAA